MAWKDKIQCPVRLYSDQYKKIRAKAQRHELTYQKVAEILFEMFLKNNKEVMRVISKYTDEDYHKKKRHPIDEWEVDELLRRIELDSPLKDVEDAIEEMEINE